MLLSPYTSPSPPLSPCPLVYSLCLFHHFWSVNKFFSTIFLDSVYMHQNKRFIFLFMTYFTLYNRFQVHSTSLELTQIRSFLWPSNIPLCIDTTTSLSIYLWMGICFHILAVVNSAAMNNGLHVSLSIFVSSAYMPRSGIAGSYGGFIPNF